MSWNEHYLKLLRIKRENGHIQISPDSLAHDELIEWIEEQKSNHAFLSGEQIRKLLKIRISFGARDDTWYLNYFALVDFRTKHNAFPTGRHKSARWLEYQRRKHNRGYLSERQSQLLESIGVCWKISIFDQRLTELKDFNGKNGHTRVPWNHSEHPGLGHYISNTLRAHKDRLSTDQIKALDALNFVWDVRESTWQSRYDELEKFINLNRCYPTKRTNANLAIWVRTQRTAKLSKAQNLQLNKLNYPWNPREDKWQKNFSKLQFFYKQHGHLCIPSSDPKYHHLWDWLNYQKRQWDKLPATRRLSLQQLIGMSQAA